MSKIFLAAVAASSLIAGAAVAADMPVKARPAPLAMWSNDIIKSNNQISVDFATTNYDYVEYSPGPGTVAGTPPAGSFLDSERGWVPGVAVTGSVMGDYFGLHNFYAYSRTTYVSGHTSLANAPPFGPGTDSAATWTEDARLGFGIDLSSNMMLTPYVGGGYYHWDRLNPGNFNEHYSNGYIGGGVLFQVALFRGLVFSANGMIGSTINSQMHISSGPPAPFTYNLGNSVIYKTGAMLDYAFTEHFHGNVGVDYTNFGYGQSQFDNLGGVEPRSRTSNTTVTAGIGYAF